MFIKPFIELDRLLSNQLSSSLFFILNLSNNVKRFILTNAKRVYIINTNLSIFWCIFSISIISNEDFIHNKSNLDLKFKSNLYF